MALSSPILVEYRVVQPILESARWNIIGGNYEMKSAPRKKARIVAKFGGSSLDTPEKIQKAAISVAKEVQRGNKVAVVVSAMGRTTDTLLNLAQVASNGSISKRDTDSILSMGERLSAKVFSASLRSHGVQTHVFDPAEENWPIISDDSFTDANPLLDESLQLIKERILPLVEKKVVPIVPGFVGKTRSGVPTTLGRGGSDITAFMLAQGLEAKKVVLVSDVDGILTADPKLVKKPGKIEKISVLRLAGLANTGTKFMHLKALKYKKEDIDVYLVNSSRCNLSAAGTLISGSLPDLEVELGETVRIISVTYVGEQLSTHPEIFLKVFRRIESSNARISGISGNHNSIIFYLSSATDPEILNTLHRVVVSNPETIAMAVRKNLALVQIRGLGLEETPGIIGRISAPLRDNGINIFGILTVSSSIDLFVDWNDREKAIRLVRSSLSEGI
jgi:aspartate kinase